MKPEESPAKVAFKKFEEVFKKVEYVFKYTTWMLLLAAIRAVAEKANSPIATCLYLALFLVACIPAFRLFGVLEAVWVKPKSQFVGWEKGLYYFFSIGSIVLIYASCWFLFNVTSQIFYIYLIESRK